MGFFSPAPHIPRLPEAEVKRRYPIFRWRVLEATFVGYAMYYLVRNNLSVVAKDLELALGYNRSMIGNILAVTAISYGFGKFFLGALSDRSDPRKFIAFGLVLTAACNFAFGGMRGFSINILGWQYDVSNYTIHLVLWTLNGFIQGMGWPPCGRSMGHWFSEKERGLTFSIWNTSHNLGGGIAGYIAGKAAFHFGGWEYAFYVPGVLALIGAVYLFFRLVDTPQSVGLPPIEEHNNDLTDHEKIHGTLERNLSFRELFVGYVLTNKFVWLLAIANFFAYVTRYSMLDWGPTYLRDVKGADVKGGGLAILFNEFGGIPSTILLGWVSDRIGGRRGRVAVLSLIPAAIAFWVILITPAGHFWLDLTMLSLIGFCIYPVINLIVIMALDLTSKKAIGTAAGFIGLFGYLGRTAQAKGFGWMLDHYKETVGIEMAWTYVFYAIIGCTLIGIALLAFTWNQKPKA
jgi:OPA family glycerol-3-phosphate transporter-like MFS transporter